MQSDMVTTVPKRTSGSGSANFRLPISARCLAEARLQPGHGLRGQRQGHLRLPYAAALAPRHMQAGPGGLGRAAGEAHTLQPPDQRRGGAAGGEFPPAGRAAAPAGRRSGPCAGRCRAADPAGHRRVSRRWRPAPATRSRRRSPRATGCPAAAAGRGPGRYPPPGAPCPAQSRLRRISRPGASPVRPVAPRKTGTPLVQTSSMPSLSCFGSSKVARSMTLCGSNSTRSA